MLETNESISTYDQSTHRDDNKESVGAVVVAVVSTDGSTAGIEEDVASLDC